MVKITWQPCSQLIENRVYDFKSLVTAKR